MEKMKNKTLLDKKYDLLLHQNTLQYTKLIEQKSELKSLRTYAKFANINKNNLRTKMNIIISSLKVLLNHLFI